jgi:hypothetical protein
VIVQRALTQIGRLAASEGEHGSATAYFQFQDGIVNGLVAKRVLYRASTGAAYQMVFPYDIQPWAYRLLRENPDLPEGGG